MSGTPLQVATTLLELTEILRQVYHPTVMRVNKYWNGTMNKLVKPSKRRFDGSTMRIDCIDRFSYPSRFSKDPNADYPDPQSMSGNNYTVTFSNTPANNDFGRHAASVSILNTDMERRVNRADQSAIEDFKKEKFDQAVKDVAESRNIHAYLPTTGLLGLVNGTAVKADGDIVAECNAISTTGGARFRIDNGSIAYFSPGKKVGVYNGSGSSAVFRFDVMVMAVEPRDNSVAVYGLDADGNPSSTVDISAIADNDGLYVQDEKDQCPISVGAWMTRVPGPATTDTMFQKNRNDVENLWMKPKFSGPVAASARPYALSDWDTLGIESAYTRPDIEEAIVTFGRPEMLSTMINAIGRDVVVQFPSAEQRGKFMAQNGFDGAIIRHHRLGRCMLESDPLMKPNTIWHIVPGTFELLSYYADVWQWMPGLVGNWYRCVSPSGNGSLTDVWRCDGHGLFTTICLDPGANIVQENLTPTATVSIPGT